MAADDSENWKPSVKIFRLLEESLSLRRAAVNQTGDASFCWDKNTQKLANTSWPQIGIESNFHGLGKLFFPLFADKEMKSLGKYFSIIIFLLLLEKIFKNPKTVQHCNKTSGWLVVDISRL